eukprot:15026676-Alexandrium_andersonii.AAC.1
MPARKPATPDVKAEFSYKGSYTSPYMWDFSELQHKRSRCFSSERESNRGHAGSFGNSTNRKNHASPAGIAGTEGIANR